MKYFFMILAVLIPLLFSTCKKVNEDKKILDFDGNVYSSVVIGNQTWMIENLKTTHFNNGAEISLGATNNDWESFGGSFLPAYCWYNNDESLNKSSYGALYNFYAVNTGNLCPLGWHVPTKEEWDTLSANLGGDNLAGGKIKETGITHWVSPNLGATNESGLTALPGGSRSGDGIFAFIGENGFWWTNTITKPPTLPYWRSGWACKKELDYDTYHFFSFNDEQDCGLSIRCVKD